MIGAIVAKVIDHAVEIESFWSFSMYDATRANITLSTRLAVKLVCERLLALGGAYVEGHDLGVYSGKSRVWAQAEVAIDGFVVNVTSIVQSEADFADEMAARGVEVRVVA